MLSEEQVRYIAHLSRIHLEDHEVKGLTKNLADILHYIDKLSQADVKDIGPTSHVLPLKNVFREDKVLPSLPQDDVMKMSVENSDGSFKVPKVIE